VRHLLFILTLSYILTACGPSHFSVATPSPGPVSTVVDQSLQPYLDRFVSYSLIALGNKIELPAIGIQFADLGFSVEKGGTNGRCTRDGTGAALVEIDRLFWQVTDEYRRENLLFHEFGHCILHREHLEAVDQFGAPISIMFPYTLSTGLYSSRRNYYISELFQNSEFNPTVHALTSVTSVSMAGPSGANTTCTTSLVNPRR
jgi:hypothetical protein